MNKHFMSILVGVAVLVISAAIVEFAGDDTHRVHYVRQPFQREPDFGVTSVNYSFSELIERAEEPR